MDFNSKLREYLEKNASFENTKKDELTLIKASIKFQVDIVSYAVSKDLALARLQEQILRTRIYKDYFTNMLSKQIANQ